MAEANEQESDVRRKRAEVVERKGPPEVYAIVVECTDEGQQREMFERLKGEGVKVKLLVL